MSTFMDDTVERGPLANDVVVVCGNEWSASAASPTTLSGSVFEAAAAAIYGLPSSSYAPDSSFLGVSSFLGLGQQAQVPTARAI